MGLLANVVAKFDASSATTAKGQISELAGSIPGASDAMGALEGAVSALQNPLVLLGTALVAAMTAMVSLGNEAIEAADNLRDMGIGSGTATSELQALQAVADKSGGSLESLESGLQFLSRGLTKGGEETQKFTKALEYFGVSQLDAAGNMKDSETIAKELAVAYSKTENSASKSAAAADAMGNNYKKLIPTYLELGNKQEELNFLQEVGAVTTQELQDASDEYNDTLTDNNNIMKGLGNYAATTMIPLLQAIASQFKESATNGGILEGTMTSLKVVFDGLIFLGKTLVASFIGVDTIFQILGKSLGGFAAIVDRLLNRDFAGAKTIFNQMGDDIDGIVDGSATRLNKMWDGIRDTTKKAGDEAEKTAKKIDRGTYRSTNEKKEKPDREIKVRVKVEGKSDLEKADDAIQSVIDGLKVANTQTEKGTKLQAVTAQMQGERFKAGSEGLKEEALREAAINDQLTQGIMLRNSLKDFKKSTDDTVQGLDDELKARTMTTKAYKEYIATRKIDEDAQERIDKLNENVEGFEERRQELLNAAVEGKQAVIDKNAELAASEADWTVGATQGLNGFLETNNNVAAQMQQTMANAFKGTEDALVSLVMTGKANFRQLAQSIIADLARMAIRALMTKAIMSFMGGSYAQGGVSTGGGMSNDLYAAGDVMQRRVTFPMANGGQGEAGENGPEAIMPLRRLPNGRLGVSSSDGGGGGNSIDVGGIYVTVGNTGGGNNDPKTQAELAAKIGSSIELRMKALINTELRNQSRPGNQLNPTRVNGVF